MCADFGLAVFFDPEALPRTDLGLEGTPWCASAAGNPADFCFLPSWPAGDGLLCVVGPPVWQMLPGRTRVWQLGTSYVAQHMRQG